MSAPGPRWLVCLGLALAAGLGAAVVAADPRRSSFEDMSASTQALQRDDTQNPAMLWVADGEQRFGADCARCHDDNAGRRLAGASIPQAHPTGYPIYRLEWQGMGSLQRRLRNCMTGVRAEPYAYGSDEFTAIELYLKQRATGMAVESPAVRP
jgi:sulfur-oxidizing protein SoxA